MTAEKTHVLSTVNDAVFVKTIEAMSIDYYYCFCHVSIQAYFGAEIWRWFMALVSGPC